MCLLGALFAVQTVIYRVCLLLGEVEGSTLYSATVLILQGRLIYLLTAALNFIAIICVV